MVFGFSYSGFYQLRYDPLHIVGCILGHIALILILTSFMLPRWLNIFIPAGRKATDGKIAYAPNITIDADEARETAGRTLEENDLEDMSKSGSGSSPTRDIVGSSEFKTSI